MTADPGTYDAQPEPRATVPDSYDDEPDFMDIEAEATAREDARDEAAVEWRRNRILDAAFPDPDRMVTSAVHAIDKTLDAITPRRPTHAPEDGIADAKDHIARMRARVELTDATLALVAAEFRGLEPYSEEWKRLMDVVRTRGLRALGVVRA